MSSTALPDGQCRRFPSSTTLNGGTDEPDDPEYDVLEGTADAPRSATGRSSPSGVGANDSKRTAGPASIGPAIARGRAEQKYSGCMDVRGRPPAPTLPKKWEAGWFGKALGDAGGAARRGAREGRYRS